MERSQRSPYRLNRRPRANLERPVPLVPPGRPQYHPAAGEPGAASEYYFGATGGGVWKTTDGGINWRPVSDRFFKTSSVGAIAIAASNPDVVYVGMGETQLRGNIIQGDGVYKTTDGGKTWTHIGLEKTRRSPACVSTREPRHRLTWRRSATRTGRTPTGRVQVDRRRQDVAARAVPRREDGRGRLSIDPKNPDTIYAGLWEVFRTPHSLSSGGPGSGLFKSTDGGDTWTELTKNPGLPQGVWGKVGVSVSAPTPTASTRSSKRRRAGSSCPTTPARRGRWQRRPQPAAARVLLHARLRRPEGQDTVYVLNVQFKSTDAGKT
jgi:hypothetical protein